MARTIGKLTALKVDKARKPGMYGDGGGLYLRVTADGAKNWVFRFMLHGRPRWMGMGPLHTVSMAELASGRPSIDCNGMTVSIRSRRGVPHACRPGSMTPRG